MADELWSEVEESENWNKFCKCESIEKRSLIRMTD